MADSYIAPYVPTQAEMRWDSSTDVSLYEVIDWNRTYQYGARIWRDRALTQSWDFSDNCLAACTYCENSLESCFANINGVVVGGAKCVFAQWHWTENTVTGGTGTNDGECVLWHGIGDTTWPNPRNEAPAWYSELQRINTYPEIYLHTDPVGQSRRPLASAWSQWSACSAPCDGTGNGVRTRSFYQHAYNSEVATNTWSYSEEQPCWQCTPSTSAYSPSLLSSPTPLSVTKSFTLIVNTTIIDNNGDVITSFPIGGLSVFIDGASLRSDITLTHLDTGTTIVLVQDSLRNSEFVTGFVIDGVGPLSSSFCNDITMRRVTFHSRGVADDRSPIGDIDTDVRTDGSTGDPRLYPYHTLDAYCYARYRDWSGWSDYHFAPGSERLGVWVESDSTGYVSGGSFTGDVLADSEYHSGIQGELAHGTWQLNITNRAQLGSMSDEVYTPMIQQWGINFIGLYGCTAGYYGTGLTINSTGFAFYDCEPCPTGLTTMAGISRTTTIDDCRCGSGYDTNTTIDSNGNTTYICTDVTPPVIVCPSNISRGSARDFSATTATTVGQVITWATPVVSDNSGEYVLSAPSLTNGGVYTAGIYTVSYTATDTAGLASSCSFTVTVTEIQADVCDASAIEPYPWPPTTAALRGDTLCSGPEYSCEVASDGHLKCWGPDALVALTPTDVGYTTVSCGSGYACALTTAATITCWGVGLTETPPSGTFYSISAGWLHACGVKVDGTIVCWGLNQYGEALVPYTRTDWVQVAAGDTHTCGLTASGQILCWGRDTANQLAAPSTSEWKYVAATRQFTCAINQTNVLTCWGTTLGASMRSATGQPDGMTNVARISINQFMTGVIQTNGLLRGFGGVGPAKSMLYFFGSGTRPSSAVACGLYHACWRDSNSITTCDIRVDPSSYLLTFVPYRPTSWPQITQVATGSDGWTCTLSTITSYPIDTLGFDTLTPVIDSGITRCYNGPAPIVSTLRFRSIAMYNGRMACGLYLTASTVHCWAGAKYAECPTLVSTIEMGVSDGLPCTNPLDDGASSDGKVTGRTPGYTSTSGTMTALAVGDCSACVLISDANRYGCWGDWLNSLQPDSGISGVNGFGGLDQYVYNGDTAEMNFWQAWTAIPPAGTTYQGHACMGGVAVDVYDNVRNQSAPDQPFISAGIFNKRHHHLCDLLDTGNIHCTVNKRSTKLKMGWSLLVKVPVGKPTGTVFTSVSCGESHVCGLLSDGTHHCQDVGKFPDDGNDSSGNVLLNQPLSSAYGGLWSAFGTHRDNACGVKLDGSLYCWGSNTNAQLLLPTIKTTIFTGVSVGLNHICGYGTSSIMCWGATSLQIGAISATPSCTPDYVVYVTPSVLIDRPFCGPLSLPCATISGAVSSLSRAGSTLALDGASYSFTTFSLFGLTIRRMTAAEGWNGLDVIMDGNLTSSLVSVTIASGAMTIRDVVFTNTGTTAPTAPAVTLAEQAAGVSFIDCTWTNNVGSSTTGGAVQLQLRAGATFTNCVFHNNGAVRGGAIFGQFATISLVSCTFSNNTASIEGGAIYSLVGDISVTDSTTFIYNSAFISGGAISLLQGTLSIGASSFTSNTAPRGGAIYACGGATVTLTDSSFERNVATSFGGAIDLETNTAASSITATTFTSNVAPIGGAISISDTPLYLLTCVFDQNSAVTDITSGIAAVGGGISCTQTGDITPVINIIASSFMNGVAQYGGAISSSMCTIAITNTATSSIYTLFTSSTDTSSFTSNVASNGGGMLYASDAIIVMNGTYATTNESPRGGVLATSSSTVTTVNCNFISNIADSGAVYYSEQSSITSTSNSFSGNTAVYGSNSAPASTGHTLVPVNTLVGNQQSGMAITPAIMLQLWDDYNQVIFVATQTVTATVISGTGTLTNGIIPLVAGVADFSSLLLLGVEGAYTIHFAVVVTSLGGTPSTISYDYPVTLVPCTPGQQLLSLKCTPCAIGFTSATTNSATCSGCAEGTYGTASGCVACVAGKYQRSTGQLSCDACPAGKYGNQTGLSACNDCITGRFAPTTGYTYGCDACVEGSYTGVNGTIACTSCAAGTIAASQGATKCSACAAGRYQSATGKTICDECLAPTYSLADTVAIVSCQAAPTGFYVNTSGSSTPLPCAQGRYSNDAEGVTKCSDCSAGKYLQSEQGIVCFDADLGYYVDTDRSTSQLACAAGYYSAVAASIQCSACGTGTYSLGGASACSSCVVGQYQVATNASCVSCPTGTYGIYNNSVYSCVECRVGYYSKVVATTECSACADGQFTVATGQSVCTSCGAGKYSFNSQSCEDCAIGSYSSGGSSSCTLSPAGSYVNTTGASVSTPCAKGSCQPLKGNTTCTVCECGKFADATGSSECTSARAGYYVGVTSATSESVCARGSYSSGAASICVACSAGTYAPTEGLSACLDCGSSATSAAGASSCVNCPPNSIVGFNTCKCNSGFYAITSNNTMRCEVCPVGAECTGIGSTAAALTISTGTWKLVTADGAVETYTCPGDRCDGGNCSANRKPIEINPLCGACLNDDYSEWSGNCIECTKNNGGYIFLLLLISFGYVLFLLRASMGNSSSHTKIFSYFLATARFMLNDQLTWLAWMGILDFSPDRSSGGTCVVPLSAYGQMAMQAVVALLFFADLAIIAFFDWLIHTIRVKYFKHALGPYQYDHYFRTFVAILLFSYTSVTDVVFTYLNCVEVGPYSVVFKYPAISCREARYNSWFALVAVGLVFPVIGLPLGLIIIMVYLTTCKKKTNWREQYRARFGILYETYKAHIPWWEAVALLRRTLFVVSAWLLFNEPRGRYQAFNLLCLIFLLIQLYVQPFEDAICNKLESMSLFALTILAALLAGSTDVSTTTLSLTVAVQVLVTLTVLPPLCVFAGVIFIRKLGRSIPCLHDAYIMFASEAELALWKARGRARTATKANGPKVMQMEDGAPSSPNGETNGNGGTGAGAGTGTGGTMMEMVPVSDLKVFPQDQGVEETSPRDGVDSKYNGNNGTNGNGHADIYGNGDGSNSNNKANNNEGKQDSTTTATAAIAVNPITASTGTGSGSAIDHRSNHESAAEMGSGTSMVTHNQPNASNTPTNGMVMASSSPAITTTTITEPLTDQRQASSSRDDSASTRAPATHEASHSIAIEF